MCLGRVKGTRVATSAAGQTEETAGCSEERAEWTAKGAGGGGRGDRAGTGRGRGGRRGDLLLGGWMHLRVTRACYRDEFHSPDRFQREDALGGRRGGGRGWEGPRFGTGNSRHPVFPGGKLEPRIRQISVESAGDRICGGIPRTSTLPRDVYFAPDVSAQRGLGGEGG